MTTFSFALIGQGNLLIYGAEVLNAGADPIKAIFAPTNSGNVPKSLVEIAVDAPTAGVRSRVVNWMLIGAPLPDRHGVANLLWGNHDYGA
jgi:hypothetical protein